MAKAMVVAMVVATVVATSMATATGDGHGRGQWPVHGHVDGADASIQESVFVDNGHY